MGLDSGAGNGKYVPHATSYPSPDGPVSTAIAQGHAGQDGRAGYAGPSNGPKDKLPHVGPSRRVIALDRSQGLLDIAKTQLDPGVECLRAELGYEGWRRGVFVSSPTPTWTVTTPIPLSVSFTKYADAT